MDTGILPAEGFILMGLNGHNQSGALTRKCAVPLIIAVLVLLGSPSARADNDCTRAPVAGGHQMHVQFAGHPRYVLVHIPRGITAGRRVPLVVALHGAGSNGGTMEHYSGLSHASDLNGFVVVYPNAGGPTWNIARSRGARNDVAFIAGLITRLQDSYCLDPHRVFATGVSNGGGMAALLGCALSGRLAAIAPVAGIYDGEPPCQPANPISVLEIHGTSDQIAPYFGPGVSASSQQPPSFVTAWVHRDSCSRTATAHQIATRTILYRWSGCAAGAIVEHVRILGGGHQWPGALPPDPGPRSTICGACEIWSFFSGVSRRDGSSDGGVGVTG
jgi:polyhydroxybutyrate depolymerase